MLVSNCCKSVQNQETPEINDVIIFPAFPAPVDKDGNTFIVFDEEKQSVTMPFWYWKKIVFYVLETENAIKAISGS